MGGATPAYGVATVKEGEDLADELWDTFGGGYKRNATAYRPFGNATVDGFDLDIENGEKLGYTAFVNKMRQNYGELLVLSRDPRAQILLLQNWIPPNRIILLLLLNVPFQITL